MKLLQSTKLVNRPYHQPCTASSRQIDHGKQGRQHSRHGPFIAINALAIIILSAIHHSTRCLFTSCVYCERSNHRQHACHGSVVERQLDAWVRQQAGRASRQAGRQAGRKQRKVRERERERERERTGQNCAGRQINIPTATQHKRERERGE